MATRHDVLVLDGDKVAALDIVRALGRRDLRVAVAASRPDALSFRSRFARSRLVYPDPRTNPDQFVGWLQAALDRNRVGLVIPVTDLTTIPIAANAPRLRGLSALATESIDRLQIVCDKLQTIELARRVSVPVPETRVIRSMDDLREDDAWTFPVVCKPLRSAIWGDKSFCATTVSYAFDRVGLREEAARTLPTCPLLIQECRRGAGVGLEVLARNGELLQVFQHRRLHELPLTGGGSTYRISEAVDSVLRGHTARLIASLEWTGVAMVEFKVDERGGGAVLMEINGRFWGSLPLSSRAGMSFAGDLYDLHVHGRAHPQRPYRVGVRCRKLGDDLEWFKERWTLEADDRLVTEGLVPAVSRGALVAGIARASAPIDRLDVQVWWDPVPGLMDLAAIARVQAAGVTRRIRRLGRACLNRCIAASHRRRGRRAAAGANRFLFICYGNIMRSAFAGGYFRHLAAAHAPTATVSSAGLHDRSGRSADRRAITSGLRWGVDLSGHRSRAVSQADVEWADLILVMDHANLEGIRRRFPSAADKTILLGAIAPGPGADIEIRDPYCDADQAMDAACRRIARAIDALLRMRMAPAGRRA